jgi:protein-tyrosine phosphatase
MDRQNYKDVIRLAQNDAQKAKVSLFLDDDIVPDPYYDDAYMRWWRKDVKISS